MITGSTVQYSCHANTTSSEVKNLSTSEPEKKSAINEGIEMPEGIYEEILRSYDGLRHRDDPPKVAANSNAEVNTLPLHEKSTTSIFATIKTAFNQVFHPDGGMFSENHFTDTARSFGISEKTSQKCGKVAKEVFDVTNKLAGNPVPTTTPKVKQKID
jgi:hypothetical protein